MIANPIDAIGNCNSRAELAKVLKEIMEPWYPNTGKFAWEGWTAQYSSIGTAKKCAVRMFRNMPVIRPELNSEYSSVVFLGNGDNEAAVLCSCESCTKQYNSKRPSTIAELIKTLTLGDKIKFCTKRTTPRLHGGVYMGRYIWCARPAGYTAVGGGEYIGVETDDLTQFVRITDLLLVEKVVR